MNDEKLGAFLDRELTDEQRAEAAHAMSENPGASTRMFMFRRSDDLLRQAVPLPKSPNDHAVAQRILSAPSVLQPYARWATSAAALAAACVLGVLLGRASAPETPFSLRQLDSHIQTALNTAASGDARTTAAGTVTVAMTLRDESGRMCRQFRTESGRDVAEAMACLEGDRWDVIAIADASEEQSGFRTASEASSALSLVLDAVGGATLVEQGEEQALISRGWREGADR